MPDTTQVHIPRYSRHASGQAVVRLNGKDHYLGKYGTAAAKAAYERLIGEWLNGGRQLPKAGASLSVHEVLVAYVRWAQGYYGPDHRVLGCIRDALKIVKALYGHEPADQFGPKALKAVRQKMVEAGWCRNYVNEQASRVRRVFRWAVSEEMLPGEVYHRLEAVDGLRRGIHGVRESAPVKPAPVALVEAARPYMPPPVRALVDLQLVTGMRPGEATIMRGCDLNTTGAVWVYQPARHKTEVHGHSREVLLGPRAQEIVRQWLKTDLQAYLFSPAEAEAVRGAKRRQERKSPMTPSQAKRRSKKNPRRPKGQHYDATSYRNAVWRACDKASPLPSHLAKQPGEGRARWWARLPEEQKEEVRAWRREHRWHPNQLRHNAATELRRQHGIELARIILGHASAFTTQIYAETDRQQAMEVIAKIG